MAKNTKQTSKKVATIAARALHKESTSKIQKALAGSALSQVDPDKETGKRMEQLASQALRDERTSKDTKTLAAAVLSQSNKER